MLAVLVGPNRSYATPFANETHLLVMNAGSCTFGDFVRVGVPLIVIVWVTLSTALPACFPIGAGARASGFVVAPRRDFRRIGAASSRRPRSAARRRGRSETTGPP